MLIKFLSTIIFFWKSLITPRDYTILSEEIEYKIDPNLKYQVDDQFWKDESKDWDGILDEYYVDATNKKFRNTSIPQNIIYTILRTKYIFAGKIYNAISYDLNFKVGKEEKNKMHFTIPLSNVSIVDHDDKPVRDITEQTRRYSGPRNDFHNQKISIEHLLYYDKDVLKKQFPKIVLTNTLGMKKVISTTDGMTTDLHLP